MDEKWQGNAYKRKALDEIAKNYENHKKNSKITNITKFCKAMDEK